MGLNRTQMYAIVYYFERDIRSILNTYVLDQRELASVLTSNEAIDLRARIDREEVADDDTLDAVDFLDLRPSYDLLNRYRGELPSELASEIRANTDALDIIVPIRHRLMHARPLKPGDSERLVSALSRFTHRRWSLTRQALSSTSDPEWLPEISMSREPERILHNLPAADYDETGLIGRDDLIEQVVGMILHGRQSVITLTGEGGIGKTALALDIAYRLLDSEDAEFDAILWVSLKQERLTGMGVVQISQAIANIVGAAEKIGQAISRDFVGGVAELGQALDGIDALIIFDNLETVSGEEFLKLYEGLPDSVRYLVTSRQGIGQIERRVPVGPLDEKGANQLLAKLIKSRNVDSLNRLSGKGRQQILSELRCSPLAIKWWVMASAAGRAPAELIRDQGELLRFCVSSVFDSLSSTAKEIAVALDTIADSSTAHHIAVLVGKSMSDITPALHQLAQGSLVTTQLTAEEGMHTQVKLTETASKYLSGVVKPDDPIRVQISEAGRVFRNNEERRQLDLVARNLDPVVIHQRYPDDAPCCQLLRAAVIKSRKNKGDSTKGPDEALRLVERAKEMAPDFWEVYRVEAYIRSFYSAPQIVSALYEKALQLCSTPQEEAVVNHFYGGHLSNNLAEHTAAVERARQAHEALGLTETSVSYASKLTWAGKFEQGVDILREVLPQATGKVRIIALSSLSTALRRLAGQVAAERDFVRALELSQEAANLGIAEIVKGSGDRKLFKSTVQALEQLIRDGLAMEHNGLTLPPISDGWVEDPAEVYGTLRQASDFSYLFTSLAAISPESAEHLGLGKFREAAQSSTDALNDAPDQDGDNRERSRGRVRALNRGFGFVENAEFPDGIFFHHSAVASGRFDLLRKGEAVEFIVGRAPDGRIRVARLWH